VVRKKYLGHQWSVVRGRIFKGGFEMYILILAIVAATIGGLAVATQSGVVGLLNQRLGTLESVFITYFGGGLTILAMMILLGGGNLGEWRKLPWYAFLGGPLGLVIIGSLSYTTPRLGVTATAAVFVASQLILGAVFDHFD
jgi:transporter family-2 protein